MTMIMKFFKNYKTETARTFLGDCCCEIQMWKNAVTIKRRKYFMINSLKSMKVQGDCDIISAMKLTQNGGQWKLYIFDPPMGLN